MKKTIVLSSLILLLVSLSAFAQPKFTPQERLKMLKEKLSLTKDQSVKIEKILIKSDEDMKKLKSSENSDRTEFRKIMENSNQEIQKVLNENQKAQFKKMSEERRNKSGEMRKDGQKPPQQKPNKNN